MHLRIFFSLLAGIVILPACDTLSQLPVQIKLPQPKTLYHQRLKPHPG